MTVQILEVSEGVIQLVFNRPEARNALNRAMLKELSQLLKAIAEAPEIRAVVLTGAGDKAFAAGADIKEMKEFTPAEMLSLCEAGQEATKLLIQAPFITLAAVHGYALGGGFEMALACDFIYASDQALFGLPEIMLGVIPGFGGTQLLSRRATPALALELLATGRTLSAKEAFQARIVNAVFSTQTELMQKTFETVSKIASQPSFPLRQAKRAIREGAEGSLELGLELERNCCALCFGPEQQERMQLFMQKKLPK